MYTVRICNTDGVIDIGTEASLACAIIEQLTLGLENDDQLLDVVTIWDAEGRIACTITPLGGAEFISVNVHTGEVIRFKVEHVFENGTFAGTDVRQIAVLAE